MFYVWLSNIGGRLKSDLRFSKKLVYNTFPLPNVTLNSRAAITAAATNILKIRGEQAGASLADLYDPLVMPRKLRTAHRQVDEAIDAVFRPRKRRFADDADRLVTLLEAYEAATCSGSHAR